MDTKKKLSVSKAYTRGFDLVRSRAGFFLALMLVIAALGVVGGYLFDLAVSAYVNGVGSYLLLVVLFSGVFITLADELFKFGLRKIALRLDRGASAGYEHILVSYKRGVRYLICFVFFDVVVFGLPLVMLKVSLSFTEAGIASIADTVSGLIVVCTLIGLSGFLALIFHLYPYVLLDDQTGIQHTFRESWMLTDGAKFDLIIFYGVALLLNAVGFACFGVGLLVTVPITVVAQADVYQQLRKHTFSTSDTTR